MITLHDMSTRKRHDVLWMALDFVLQDLAEEVGTKDVAQALRERLAFPATEMPIVLTWLKKVAPLVPEASQTGEAVRVYGNIGRRWLWNPRGRVAKLGAAPHTLTPEQVAARAEAARLQALVGTATDVDDSDW